MTSIRKLALAAFLPLALISPSAHAQDDVAVVVGTGAIDPGLPESGCDFQQVTFSGTAVNAGDHAGIYNVSFAGNSTICETTGAGQGSGTLSGDVSGVVEYSRTGPIVTITGQGAVNGHAHAIVLGVCVFVPTSVNPIASYALECTVVLDTTS